MNNTALILLSGGLDSVVSLALAKKNYDIKAAVFFNYGQKAYQNEYNAVKKIADFYNIPIKNFNLEWIKEFYKSPITTNKKLPNININELDNEKIAQDSAKSVWVPNRNALFINIAACYAECMDYKYIILGANKEESKTFKDNSAEFINAINKSLKNSTNNTIQVIAPLINMNKEEIIKTGIECNIPFENIYSCYDNGKKHCGECESCLRLKRALELNNRHDIINKLFE